MATLTEAQYNCGSGGFIGVWRRRAVPDLSPRRRPALHCHALTRGVQNSTIEPDGFRKGSVGAMRGRPLDLRGGLGEIPRSRCSIEEARDDPAGPGVQAEDEGPIPAWMTGCSIPRSSQSAVRIIFSTLRSGS